MPLSIFNFNTSLGIGVSNLHRSDQVEPDVNASSFVAYFSPNFSLPVDLSIGAGVFLKPTPERTSDEGGVLPSFSLNVGYKLPCSITAFSGISKNSDPMSVSLVLKYQKNGDLLDSYGLNLKFGI